MWSRVYAYIALRVQALYNIAVNGVEHYQMAIGLNLMYGETLAMEGKIIVRAREIKMKAISILQYIQAIPLALYYIFTTGLESNALVIKSTVEGTANMTKADSIILYIHEIALKVRSIATSIYENTIGAIGVFWKEMQAKATAKI